MQSQWPTGNDAFRGQMVAEEIDLGNCWDLMVDT